MQGKQHRQGNAFMSIPITIYLILYLGFSYWYLGIPIVMTWNADFEDVDQYRSVPKKWKLFKKVVQYSLKVITTLSVIILVYACYRLYNVNASLTSNEFIAFTASIITLLIICISYWYTSTDNGKFLLQHRGFTHTLVIPIALLSIYVTLNNSIDINANADNVSYYLINILKEILCVVILGFAFGCVGHTFLDSLCKAGVPLLWPLSKSTISFGNAITSDSKAKDGTHISSKIYTYCVCIISILISAYLIYNKIQ